MASRRSRSGLVPVDGAPDAVLLVGVAPPGPIRVTITATPASRPAQHPEMSLRVNDCRLASQAMPAGQGDYEWLAGERCWRAGMNQIAIGVTPLLSPAASFASHDTRLLGARVGAIRLTRRAGRSEREIDEVERRLAAQCQDDAQHQAHNAAWTAARAIAPSVARVRSAGACESIAADEIGSREFGPQIVHPQRNRIHGRPAGTGRARPTGRSPMMPTASAAKSASTG